jgi:hypothetical protein
MTEVEWLACADPAPLLEFLAGTLDPPYKTQEGSLS